MLAVLHEAEAVHGDIVRLIQNLSLKMRKTIRKGKSREKKDLHGALEVQIPHDDVAADVAGDDPIALAADVERGHRSEFDSYTHL